MRDSYVRLMLVMLHERDALYDALKTFGGEVLFLPMREGANESQRRGCAWLVSRFLHHYNCLRMQRSAASAVIFGPSAPMQRFGVVAGSAAK